LQDGRGHPRAGAADPRDRALRPRPEGRPAMRPLHLAPELAPYQDEPPQLPTGSPGKVAHLRLGFERRGGRSVLTDLFRRAPLIVHRAIYWDEEMPGLPCVFIVSNAGGILQGDRNTIS